MTRSCASSLLKEDRLLGYLQHTSLVPLTRNNAPRCLQRLLTELHRLPRNAVRLYQIASGLSAPESMLQSTQVPAGSS